jgi:hypothetical protein
LAPIGEPIAPLTAPDHFVTPLGRSELVGLIGQPPLRHTHCAVAIWAHPEARLVPLAGHYPRRMPVIQGQLRAVQMTHRPPAGAVAATFQAGHASSILVTRSIASFLVRSTLSLPNIFEHPGDNNDQAGHVHFMIIAGDESKCLVGRDFMRPASWVCDVDQAGSVPNSCQ